jgi:nifR3 family TIM-barrel protein
MKTKYAGISIDSPAVLAPMSGITSLPFRLLCRELGAGLMFTEFTSAIAIARNRDHYTERRLFDRIKTVEEEHPCGVQLFSPNEKELVEAIDFVEKDFEIIDLNFGCPSTKIVGASCGAFLLKEPEKLLSLVKAAVDCSSKSITCKLRTGYDNPVLREFVEKIQDCGVKGIALHARTAQQGYSGKADWEYIKKIHSLLSIPLIGNGDIQNASDVKEKIENDYCDLVMIGRKAWHNPAIFAEVIGKEAPSKKELLERFFVLCEKYNTTPFSDVKAIVSGIVSGMKGAKRLRTKLMQARTFEELEKAVSTALTKSKSDE